MSKSTSRSFNFDDGKAVVVEDKLAPVHDFEKESELTGYYLGFEENVGENKSNVYRFDTQHGIVAVWATTLLKRQLQEIAIEEPITIKYLGEKPTKNPELKYKDFQIIKQKLKTS